MDEQVINLKDYLARRGTGARTSFAVWGGEGDRSRLALPVWRAIYLVGGERAALVCAADDSSVPKRLEPMFILDLGSDTPRTEFDATLTEGLWETEMTAPDLRDRRPGGVAVYLGAEDDRRWFMIIDDGGAKRDALVGRARDDLMFLAGECAGLLFHYGFAQPEG